MLETLRSRAVQREIVERVAAPRLPDRPLSFVYFIRSRDLCKIGRASDPLTRFEQIRICNPHDLAIVGLMPGGATEEAQLHRHYRRIHRGGEWFIFTVALRKDIEAICPPDWRKWLNN